MKQFFQSLRKTSFCQISFCKMSVQAAALAFLVSQEACLPMYQHDVSPDVFVALPRELRISQQKLAVLVVHRRESASGPAKGDQRVVGEPILTDVNELRETYRRIRSNSLQFRSPLGVLFGANQEVEEVCIIAVDGSVTSLRRAEGSGRLSNDWREKSFGKLIEPGRDYLLKLLEDPSRKLKLPEELLSACSLGERHAEFHWSEGDREAFRKFLLEKPEPPEPAKPAAKD